MSLKVNTPDLLEGDIIKGGLDDAGLSLPVKAIRGNILPEGYWQIEVEGLNHINAHSNKVWTVERPEPPKPEYAPRTIALLHGVPYMRDNAGRWHYVQIVGGTLHSTPGGIGQAVLNDAGVAELVEKLDTSKIIYAP